MEGLLLGLAEGLLVGRSVRGSDATCIILVQNSTSSASNPASDFALAKRFFPRIKVCLAFVLPMMRRRLANLNETILDLKKLYLRPGCFTSLSPI